MTDVTCIDGRLLTLRPEPVLGRDGVAYEAQLHLLLDGVAYGVVGERCRGVLAAALEREPAGGTRDRELFALRGRDPDDLPGVGAVRALHDVRRRWTAGAWQTHEQVLLEAWGTDGTGVRVVLTVDGLLDLVRGLLAEIESGSPGPS